MALAAGVRLGPYEILSAIGAGGMGEVWKANDTRLDRPVAIKVLPAHLTASPAARERLQREARAVAVLHHPHICTIYDVGETDDGQYFIVMELLEGETLHERLVHGAFEVPQFIDVGIALADALDAAHARRLIHRDIKPGNIFLTSHGPKILDFGLAKSVVGAAAVSMQPTMSRAGVLTDPGSTVGTVAYMSPEQLRGEELDGRSDLFSLGLVLYEMATGRPAYTGTTNAVISAAILHQPAMSVRQIRSDLPVSLEQVIAKTLEKDRDIRCQTASELRADLRRVKREIGAAPPHSPAQTPTAASAVRAPVTTSVPASSDTHLAVELVKRHRAVAAAAVAVVLAAIAGGIYMAQRQAAPEGASASLLDEVKVTQLTTSGNAERPAISPDGRYVAYIQRDGNRASLWIRQATTASNIQIVSPEEGVDLQGVTVTPDGTFVDFVRTQQARRSLWRVPFLGGTPIRLIDDVWTPVGWSPDGHRLTFVRSNVTTGDTVVVANADGTGERVLASRRPPAWFSSVSRNPGNPSIRPAWSPDGRSIAVVSGNSVVAIDAATGTERELSLPPGGEPQGLAWLNAESFVLNYRAQDGDSTQLWRLSFPDGRSSRLTNDLHAYVGASLSQDRTSLVTARSETRASIWVGNGDASSGNDAVPPTPFLRGGIAYLGWAGERLLYTSNTGGESEVISVVPHGNVPAIRIPNTVQGLGTSDGRRLILRARGGFWTANADGQDPIRLMDGSIWPVITPDDRFLLVLRGGTGIQSPWMVSLDGGTPTQVANLAAASYSLDVSPNSKSIVFRTRDDENRSSLVICDLPDCASRRNLPEPPQASTPGRLRWTPDGRAIAYVRSESNIWIQPLDGSAPRQITQFTDGRVIADFAWSHDGTRLAISRLSVINDIVLFRGLNGRSAKP